MSAQRITAGPSASPGFLLWRTTLLWQRKIRDTLKPFELTHVQFVLLASLWWLQETELGPSQRTLAEHAGTDPMMTSQVLRTLERRGLVTREPNPQDRRAHLLKVTSTGVDLVQKAIVAVEEADATFFSPLGQTEAIRLLRSLANFD